jgi:hypothetical protein
MYNFIRPLFVLAPGNLARITSAVEPHCLLCLRDANWLLERQLLVCNEGYPRPENHYHLGISSPSTLESPPLSSFILGKSFFILERLSFKSYFIVFHHRQSFILGRQYPLTRSIVCSSLLHGCMCLLQGKGCLVGLLLFSGLLTLSPHRFLCSEV